MSEDRKARLDEIISRMLAPPNVHILMDRDDLRELREIFDTASSASRQHYIDTGRYLRVGGSDGPKIEILHTRDPDSACGITVWLDGQRTDDFAEESIDPGRGWTREDWDEAIRDTREGHPDYSDAFRQAAVDAWESFDGNEFIDG